MIPRLLMWLVLAHRAWRRMPARQRRRLSRAAGRRAARLAWAYGPRIVSTVARRTIRS